MILEFECEVSTCRVEAGREGFEATASSAKHTWVTIFIIQSSNSSIFWMEKLMTQDKTLKYDKDNCHDDDYGDEADQQDI